MPWWAWILIGFGLGVVMIYIAVLAEFSKMRW